MLLRGPWEWELVEEFGGGIGASRSECARIDFRVRLLDVGKGPGGIGDGEETEWGEADGELAAGVGVGGFSSTEKLGLLTGSAVQNKRTFY